MYPSTLKMTKPAMKLVAQLMELRKISTVSRLLCCDVFLPCDQCVLVAVVVELVVAGEG